MPTHYFSCSSGPAAISQNAHKDILHRTYVFAFGGIYGSHSALQCLRSAKHEHTIFHSWLRLEGIQQKTRQDTLRWSCVFATSGIYVSCSTFWCVRGMRRWHNIFHARVGLVQIPQKACWDMLCQTCILVFGGIYGSRSAFWCVRGAKLWCTIFHARVGLVRITQIARRDTLHQTCIFASGGTTGHVVHSSASGAWKVDALCFMLWWAGDPTKSAQGHVTLNLSMFFAPARIGWSRSHILFLRWSCELPSTLWSILVQATPWM
jgi:hypothetical protein